MGILDLFCCSGLRSLVEASLKPTPPWWKPHITARCADTVRSRRWLYDDRSSPGAVQPTPLVLIVYLYIKAPSPLSKTLQGGGTILSDPGLRNVTSCRNS